MINNKIMVNFKNIISELEEKNLKLCFLQNRGMFILDSENNMYNFDRYKYGSYLDNLIKKGITVEFNCIDASISQNIGDWEREIWGVTEVENFIKRQHLSQYR